MNQKKSNRCEVMIAGVGGMGVLMAGQVLSGAAGKQFEYVSWAPSYAGTKRGGSCECTVIFSDEEIASPILDQAQTLIVLDGAQFEDYEPRVRPGGTVISESAGLTFEKTRDDIELVKVSGLEVAIEMGEALINNLILLGAYVHKTGAVSKEQVEAEIQDRYSGNEKILNLNMTAFQKGYALV